MNDEDRNGPEEHRSHRKEQEGREPNRGRPGSDAGGGDRGERGGEDPGRERRRGFTEEFRVAGEDVVAKVRELVREGNVRRITLKNEEGRVLLEIPLTVGVIGSLLLPMWAAVGAVAALAANLTIAVQRSAGDPGSEGASRGRPEGKPADGSDDEGDPRPAGEDEFRGPDVMS